MKNHTPRDPGELRRQAEDQASTMEPASLSVQSPEEIQRVLHELQVHQIELELQNEELRTAQARIEAGRDRYYDLYDLAPVGYCTLSGKGLILEANLTAATLLGMSRSRLVKQPVSRFILKDDQDSYYLQIKKLLETNQAQEWELRLLKPDGALFWAHLTAAAAKAEDGAPVAHMMFSDITERKRAEEELRKSEERYRAITDHSPAGIFQTDVQGDCTYVNPRWTEITGLTFDEALGKGWSQALHPEDKQRAFDGWYAAAIAGLPYDWESRFVTKQGKQSWITGHAEVLFDQHGNSQGYIGIIVDITERKQSEEEYLKFFTITEKALFGSAIADPEGNLVYVNDYFAQIHGYTVKELTGSNLDIFHSDAQMPLVRKTIEDALKKGNIDALEIPHLHKNRHEFPMLMSLTIINNSLGKPKYIAATALDLTEQKSSQQKLQSTVNDQNLMLNNDPTLIYFKDCYNNIIRVTESVAKATGLTREEIEGRPSKEIYPDMADKYWEDDLEVIKSGKPKHNIVEPLTGVDGSSQWLLTTKVPVRNDSEEIVGICVFATNITDLKNAELGLIVAKEKAEESEERFLLAMKASHDGLFDWNLETNEIYYSPAWKIILGYEDHELPNDFSILEKFTDPKDFKKSWEMQKKLISKQIDRFFLEFKMKHKNGHWVDILSRAEALFDNKGQAVRIIGTHTDITERKQAEESLRISQERLQLATHGTGIGIWDWDIVKNDLVFDDNMLRMYGIEKENFGGVYEGWASRLHPDDKKNVEGEIQAALSGDREYSPEFRIVLPDGSVRFISAASQTFRDDQGKPVRMIGVNIDITERKKAEEALNASQAQLSNALEIAHLGHWEYDVATDIFTFNDHFYKIFRTTVEQVGGYTMHSAEYARRFVHPDDSDMVREEILKAIETTDPLFNEQIDHRILYADGTTGYITVRFLIVKDSHGRTIKTYGVNQDITERKKAGEMREKLQAQIIRIQKTESLGRMAGAIAHTFNNQLGVVIGNLEMVIEDLPRDAKPVTKLNAAMQGARKAAEVSGLMLTYLGQTTAVHVPLDLSESCRQSLPSLRAGTAHGLIFKINIPSPGPTVKANSTQIQQMLTNLVTNAREAIGEKQGTVTLTVRTVPQSEISEVFRYPTDWQAENATYACLEVTDTGCGIVNEAIDKIFDPFYSTKYAGRGLGLAVVSGIVRAHGGAITVASEEHGSTFRVFLPLSAEKIPRQPMKTAQPLARAGRGAVLLIEDEEMIRDMAKTMITRLGYTVLAAKDGIEAMEMFAQHQDEICCVVSDVTMPRMNGWETLAALRKLSPGIPVVLSSGYDEAQVLIGDHPEHPQAFLHKPYQMMELQAALAKAIED